MTNACSKWKDQLLEAALTGTVAGELEDHLKTCTQCAAELEALRARREQMDALLPWVARGPELPADFRARVIAAAEAAGHRKRAWPARGWLLAGATAVVVAALLIVLSSRHTTRQTTTPAELAAAEKLAEWQPPTDVLLRTPGQEILRTTPRLGESYVNIPIKVEEE
jgi:anti-sigma-K factor RskA